MHLTVHALALTHDVQRDGRGGARHGDIVEEPFEIVQAVSVQEALPRTRLLRVGLADADGRMPPKERDLGKLRRKQLRIVYLDLSSEATTAVLKHQSQYLGHRNGDATKASPSSFQASSMLCSRFSDRELAPYSNQLWPKRSPPRPRGYSPGIRYGDSVSSAQHEHLPDSICLERGNLALQWDPYLLLCEPGGDYG